MAEYNVEWVGDKTHDYKDRRTYSVSLVDPDGKSERKVKLERPQSAPAPTVGERVVGVLNPHPRFDDAKLFAEGSQNGSSDATGSLLSASNTRSVEGDRTDQINRSVAFKGAVDLVAAEAKATLDSGGSGADLIERVRDYTTRLLPIVTGATDPKAEAATTDDNSPRDPDDLF